MTSTHDDDVLLLERVSNRVVSARHLISSALHGVLTDDGADRLRQLLREENEGSRAHAIVEAALRVSAERMVR